MCNIICKLTYYMIHNDDDDNNNNNNNMMSHIEYNIYYLLCCFACPLSFSCPFFYFFWARVTGSSCLLSVAWVALLV